MLAWSELGDDYLKRSDDGYNVIVTVTVTGIDGKLELFNDYSTHPFASGRKSKVINSKGLTSNASGRPQFMLKDWVHYRDLLKLPDF
jgi:muramidase (phage lysozyme)